METKPEQLERETLGKVGRRLLPFLSLLFFVAYLDRVNVGFAAVTMNADVNISAAAYGFGAGLSFLDISSSKFQAISCWQDTARAYG